MSDMLLTCKLCGGQFYFTDGEQQFYKSKGFNLPQKCKSCRNKKKNSAAVRTNKRFIKDFNGVSINMYEVKAMNKVDKDYFDHGEDLRGIAFILFNGKKITTPNYSGEYSHRQRQRDYDDGISILNNLD
jgi:Probable zinc-ribbon domain